MGQDVLTQAEAWTAFDSFMQPSGAILIDEPAGIDLVFRRLTSRDEVSTKHWADGYLAAFSIASGIQLVTFDRALAGKVKGAILLA